ncbi:unnamed protein product [Lampetra planeri]
MDLASASHKSAAGLVGMLGGRGSPDLHAVGQRGQTRPFLTLAPPRTSPPFHPLPEIRGGTFTPAWVSYTRLMTAGEGPDEEESGPLNIAWNTAAAQPDESYDSPYDAHGLYHPAK